jgi:hypothetical protein
VLHARLTPNREAGAKSNGVVVEAGKGCSAEPPSSQRTPCWPTAESYLAQRHGGDRQLITIYVDAELLVSDAEDAVIPAPAGVVADRRSREVLVVEGPSDREACRSETSAHWEQVANWCTVQ